MRDLDCPSLSLMTTPGPCEPELVAHMAACPTCRALGQMAAAAASPGSLDRVDCAEVETLVAARAAGADLGAADAARLDRHLDRCGACAVAFAAIALDREGLAEIAAMPVPAEARGTWSRAVDPAAARGALRRRRIAASLAGAAGLAAAAAAVAALLPARTDQRPTAAAPRTPEPDAVLAPTARPTDGFDHRFEPSPEDQPDEAHGDVVDADVDEASGDALVEAVVGSAVSGDYAEALERCEAALELRPGHQLALAACTIAACRLWKADTAQRYLAAIRGETRRRAVNQVCLEEGLTLDEAEGPDRLESLLDEARSSAIVGLYARSLRLSRRVLRADPENQDALLFCVLASCRLELRPSAERCLSGLTGGMKLAGAQICAQDGLPLDAP